MTPPSLHFESLQRKYISGLISQGELENLLGLKFGGPVSEVVSTVLFRPLGDLMSRPGKKIRGRLVELGFQLANDNQVVESYQVDALRKLMEGVELLHAGSLAVDDVQDGSKVRRGQPSLHMKYGLPISLNIGNWLYFWPLEIVNRLNLPEADELRIYRIYHRTLLRAHMGQAMDVGVPIDTLEQGRICDICVATMELKSGALFALALLAGAVVAKADDGLLETIDTFGHGLGIGLQMFDDIGNLKGSVEPAKRREDLVLRRPTWIWACAAKYYSGDVYGQFISAVHQLPLDHHPLEIWLEQHDFMRKSTQLAHEHIKHCFADLASHIPVDGARAEALGALRELSLEIARAYE